MFMSWEDLRYLRAIGRSHVHCIGGSSESVQTTTPTDARVVGAEGSTNASIVGNSGAVSIVTSDHGAISGSLQLALAGIEGAQHITETTISAAGGLLDNALQNSAQQSADFVGTIKDIKTSDVRVLVIAGLAVVGLGAAMVFKKG